MTFKILDGDYILGIGIDSGGEKITEKEYDQIAKLISDQYATKSDKWYRLRKDLTWEEVKPPEPEKDGEKE